MSATSGTLAALAIWLKAAVDSSSGQETRTMSAPASSNSRIWPMVALASPVSVLVIDWTAIGASPPTSTDPTRILRDGRRSIRLQGRWWEGSELMAGAFSDERRQGKAVGLRFFHKIGNLVIKSPRMPFELNRYVLSAAPLAV